MLHTSSGYHTFSGFRAYSASDIKIIFKDLKKYSKNTGEIKIYPSDDIKSSYKIEYVDKYKGISWLIRYCSNSRDFKSYIVEVKINPKVFAGVKDYITAANVNDLKNIESKFDIEARKISDKLGKFISFKPNRIDYCINFDLNELDLNCTPEQMMQLIKRSNIPAHFTERKEYDKNEHRMKSDNSSFYLVSDSVVINCYYKYMQLQKYPDNPSLEESRHILRFEIQCKYIKVYSLIKEIERNSVYSNQIIYELLNDDFSKKVITEYFERVIPVGDYYTLKDAITKIKSYDFRGNKEKRMIDTLNLISQCRGISKAKETLNDKQFDYFIQALRELAAIKINPVTIPKEFGIKRISNLLDAYYRKIEDEHAKKQDDERSLEIVQDFYRRL